MIPNVRTQAWLPSVLFADFLNDGISGNIFGKQQISVPALNIVETDNGFRVELAVSGIAKEDIKIDVSKENMMVISAEAKTESEEKQERYLRREFGYTQFKRSLTLPDNVDKDAIAASFNNGVLAIEIPRKVKEESERNRTIEIA
ncbi:MAG: Hsp20/alpha crystallin family protein [Bacteroidales bacterium]|jgi:HSP20 family protein|nr:Hsp20/alpha crystallin family protein [Bacteroidales bacterium]